MKHVSYTSQPLIYSSLLKIKPVQRPFSGLYAKLTRALLFLYTVDVKLWIHSPIKHPTKSGSPGQDEGHPEVNIARVAHIWQVVFKIIQPDVLKVHSVLQPVAGVWPWEETERLRHRLQMWPVCGISRSFSVKMTFLPCSYNVKVDTSWRKRATFINILALQ